jgi:hypothetical protein
MRITYTDTGYTVAGGICQVDVPGGTFFLRKEMDKAFSTADTFNS